MTLRIVSLSHIDCAIALFKAREIFTLFGSIPQATPSSVPMEPHQLDLFSNSKISFTPANKPDTLLMDSGSLVKWKSQIATSNGREKVSQRSSPRCSTSHRCIAIQTR